MFPKFETIIFYLKNYNSINKITKKQKNIVSGFFQEFLQEILSHIPQGVQGTLKKSFYDFCWSSSGILEETTERVAEDLKKKQEAIH